MAANDTRNVDFIICFFCCFWRLWRFWVILAGHFARLFYESETEDGDVAWWPRLFAAIVGRCWNCRGSLVELRLSACRAQVRGMLDRKGAFLQGEVLPLLLTQLLATRWHAIQERIWCIWIPFDRVKWYNVNSRGLIVKIWGQNKVKKADWAIFMKISQGYPGCPKSSNRWPMRVSKVDKNSDAFGEVRLRLRQARLLRVFCLDSCDDVW